MPHLNEKARFLLGLLFYSFVRAFIFWPLVLSLVILAVLVFCTILYLVFNGVSDAGDFARTVLASVDIQQLLDGGAYCFLALVLLGGVIDCIRGVIGSFTALDRSMCRLSAAPGSRGAFKAPVRSVYRLPAAPGSRGTHND